MNCQDNQASRHLHPAAVELQEALPHAPEDPAELEAQEACPAFLALQVESVVVPLAAVSAAAVSVAAAAVLAHMAAQAEWAEAAPSVDLQSPASLVLPCPEA